MDPGTEGGGSEPHLFETSDGQFMVKVANNPQGRRVLVNELIAGLCLDWLGVRHPGPALVDVPKDVIDDSPGAHLNNGSKLSSGVAFGSEYWQSDPQGTVAADTLINEEDIAGTMALDTWIRNHDGRQYRVKAAAEQDGKYEAVPVDQGHCFGSPDWTAEGLDGERAVTVAAPIASVDAASVKPFVSRLRSFGKQDAEAIVQQVPPDWLAEDERRSVERYLTERAGLAANALDAQFQEGDSA